MRRWLALTVLVLVGLTSASCNRRPSQAVGRLNVSGRAEVDTAESGKKTVTGSRTLRSGEQVTLVEGTATLTLGNDRRLELRKGSVVRLAMQPGSTGRSEPRGELVSGDVLVLSSGDPATVVAGDNTVTVTGTARVSRGLAVVVAVYQGAAGIDAAGSATTVPALHQVTVPAPGLPSRRTPIVFSPTDSWDQRYLAEAVELGNQLAARSRGFSDQLQAGAGTVDLYRRLLPDLAQQPFTEALLDRNRMPGETLVGAAMTLQGTRGDFLNRWESVFTFHDEGAPWGFVAMAQGVAGGPLLSLVDAAVARTPGVTAPTPPPNPGTTAVTTPPPVVLPVSPTPAPSGGGGGGAGPSGEVAAGDGTDIGTASGSTPGSAPSSSGPSPAPAFPTRGPFDLGVPLVDNTLNAVVDALGGLLRAISTP